MFIGRSVQTLAILEPMATPKEENFFQQWFRGLSDTTMVFPLRDMSWLHTLSLVYAIITTKKSLHGFISAMFTTPYPWILFALYSRRWCAWDYLSS